MGFQASASSVVMADTVGYLPNNQSPTLASLPSSQNSTPQFQSRQAPILIDGSQLLQLFLAMQFSFTGDWSSRGHITKLQLPSQIEKKKADLY